jgi:hypothetical protein
MFDSETLSMRDEMSDEQAKCELCGEPMPPGEEMFKFHGYSGNCPKPPLARPSPPAVGMNDHELLAEVGKLRAEVTAFRASKEEQTEKFYLVRDQRNKLLWACQKALAAFDEANKTGKSNWSGEDVTKMRTAVGECSSEETNADLEEIDADALLKLGFTGGNDEPDVDVYDLSVSATTAGPVIRVIIRFCRGEQVASHLQLIWVYHFGSGPGRTTLRFEITDYPSRGEVRRLMQSLGVEAAK